MMAMIDLIYSLQFNSSQIFDVPCSILTSKYRINNSTIQLYIKKTSFFSFHNKIIDLVIFSRGFNINNNNNNNSNNN